MPLRTDRARPSEIEQEGYLKDSQDILDLSLMFCGHCDFKKKQTLWLIEVL